MRKTQNPAQVHQAKHLCKVFMCLCKQPWLMDITLAFSTRRNWCSLPLLILASCQKLLTSFTEGIHPAESWSNQPPILSKGWLNPTQACSGLILIYLWQPALSFHLSRPEDLPDFNPEVWASPTMRLPSAGADWARACGSHTWRGSLHRHPFSWQC